MPQRVALILAAGQGTRMKSDRLKVLHPVGGVPMLESVVNLVEEMGFDRCLVVVGYQKEAVRQLLGDRVEYLVQEEQLGTGHAVRQVEKAEPPLAADDRVLVLYGDTPLLTREVLSEVLASHERAGAAATVLTVTLDDPGAYGRIVRDAGGHFQRIVEHADATAEERAIREINTGIYAFQAGPLLDALGRLRADNAQGEFYLPDVLPILQAEGRAVQAVETLDREAVQGINDRKGLAEAEAILRQRVLDRLMENGVTILDPATTYIDATVTVGRDTVIEPFTILRGRTEIGERCSIGPGSQIIDSRLYDEVRVWQSVVEESELGRGTKVGPFSHLRPGTYLAEGAKVGNFAELKNTRVGPGSKVNHHSYLGDTNLGAGVNIGAGAVTVNYDGRQKHGTEIGDGAFIGCNVNLIAPVRVDGYVAAGSTITRDVDAGDLGIARARQENKKGWVLRRFGPRETGKR